MSMPNNQPRILVAVLDWGLGHAARCIPVVQELRQQGAAVWLGGSGRALALLRAEFPDLPFVELPAYNIHYRGKSMVQSLLFQGFKMLAAMIREHIALRKFVRRQGIRAVISDCRFGCFTRRATCVFLTHQLHIRTPHPWLSRMVNAVNRWFIRRYDERWIPDVEAEGGLAGALSHPPLYGAQYIGVLSRMKPLDVPLQYDVVAVLSGPEPQRSLLEAKILKQAAENPDIQILVVQGKAELLGNPEAGLPAEVGDHLTLLPALGATHLNTVLSAAKTVLARSGYSTLMDLARLGKPAILIPTPGQTEQEYLAAYWAEEGIFSVWMQEAFDLKRAWQEAQRMRGLSPGFFEGSGLSEAIVGLLAGLKK